MFSNSTRSLIRPLIRDHSLPTIYLAHLLYVGVLPALATFSILHVYGTPAPLLLFLGGTVAVSVYLAFIVTYTARPLSVFWALVTLLDGPVFALLSIIGSRTSLLGFAVDGFVIDGIAIWVSILILAIRSRWPTREQRIASIAFMIVAILATVWLVYPFYRDTLSGQWLALFILVLGIFESLILRFRILKQDETVQGANQGAAYIVVLLLLWVGSLIAGNVLYQIRLKH